MGGHGAGYPGYAYGPQGSYQASSYAQPAYGYSYGPAYGDVRRGRPKTNGFAIASLVCSLAGILFVGVPAVAGVIFGFVARSQIRRSGGTQTGSGMALAGIIVGFVFVAIGALAIVALIVNAVHCGSRNSC